MPAGTSIAPTSVRVNGKTSYFETTDETVKLTCYGYGAGTDNDIKDFYVQYRDSDVIDFSSSWINLSAMTYSQASSGMAVRTPDIGIYRQWRIKTRGAVDGTDSTYTASPIILRIKKCCASPSIFQVSKTVSYGSTALIWSEIGSVFEDDIISYHIQYQDSADEISWPDSWIDLETDWLVSSLEVFPPIVTGHYRRFRIKVKSSAGSEYDSDWTISSNSLRKDMTLFAGFSEPNLISKETKIKASHLTEMQTRINELLLFNKKEPIEFTTIIPKQTKISGWKNHVEEIRRGIELLGRAPKRWIPITENKPTVDVMTQLRESIMGYSSVTIKLTGDDGDISGCVVTVKNVDDNSIIKEFVYNKPTVVEILPDITWEIICSDIDGYTVTPSYGPHKSIACDNMKAELHYKRGYRYGYKREKANPDPYTRITYLYDAKDMTPMFVNLTNGEPQYGSWETFVDELCRPVMLTYDGVVDYELNHSDLTKKLDGTSSDIANSTYAGNAMVEFRKYKWVHRSEDSNFEYVIFSDVQWDDTYHAYANTNANGVNQDTFYWGMFEGTKINGIMRSLAGQTPTASQTAEDEISQAQANGSGWYLIYKSGWDFINDILTLISKTDNSQAAFGNGCHNSSAAIKTGTLQSKPMFCGYSTATSDVKVLYMEGLWGNLWERVGGLVYNKTNGIYVKMTPPYNIDGTGYLKANTITGTSANFISGSSCTDEFGFLPKSLSGSETTYICDKVWYATSGIYYGMVGGRWTLGTGCGSRSLNFSDLPTIKGTYTGARISYLAE